jgi:hypothetical protein
MGPTELSDDAKKMAREWFGYGRWDAPYWFVGIEPGGDELDSCVRMWNSLGCKELVDLRAHHEEHERDWFSSNAHKPQPTWQKLIWLLLAFKGQAETSSAVLDYQKQLLGRSNGETALLEISSLPAEHGHVEIPRMLYRAERTQTLRQRLLDCKPEFVVFYSPDDSKDHKCVTAWNAITGKQLVRDEPVVVGRTVCLMTYHPNGEWSKKYWEEMGHRLRSACDQRA